MTSPLPPGPLAVVELLERRLNAERAERRRLEAALAELTGRTQALADERDAAVAANQSKSRFLASMSHEIRTPLTSIIGFAELVQDPQIDRAEKAHAARIILRNGRHLLEMLNDILDLSKIESHQMTIEQVEVGLPKLLSDLEALVSTRAQEKSLAFDIGRHLPLPPKLRTDPVRLKQILLNFCSNAIKFSSEGRVRLDVRYEAAGGKLRFDVSDDGIGIDEEALTRLFQPFVQAEVSTTRKFGGTGLGLHICRQLADRLGATISVTSTKGEGSCFSLSLPLGLVPKPAEMLDSEHDFDDNAHPSFQVTAFEVPTLRGRVLVAEDGVDNQRLLSSYLRLAGVEFDIVANGRLAVDRAASGDYALVLMDIQMPVLDGVAATRLLRGSNYRGAIVALTASVMLDDVTHYVGSGFTDVLAKPIDRSRFYAVLQKYTSAEPPRLPETLLELSLDMPVEASAPADLAEFDYEAELSALTAEFVAGLAATFDAVEAAAAAEDLPRLAGLLHNLKGTAGSYGFHVLSAMAGDIERRVAAGEIGSALALCTAMRACVPPAAAEA